MRGGRDLFGVCLVLGKIVGRNSVARRGGGCIGYNYSTYESGAVPAWFFGRSPQACELLGADVRHVLSVSDRNDEAMTTGTFRRSFLFDGMEFLYAY